MDLKVIVRFEVIRLNEADTRTKNEDIHKTYV